ncbi:neuropeptide FF receptor 2-like, partial [Oculina patagonica]
LTAERIAKTIAYCLIFVVSLAGNTFVGIIVYKTKTMRTTINFFIVNMAMSDLLFPVFAIPWILTELHFFSWPISGPLGQALCKLRSFLLDVSVAVSVQSLVLIAADRFGAVVFPLRSPLISSKLYPYFIFTTWITAITLLFPSLIAYKLVEYPGRLACEMRWKEAFGKTSNMRDFFFVPLISLYLIPFTVIMILYTGILLKLKLQKHIGEPSTNAEKQRYVGRLSLFSTLITLYTAPFYGTKQPALLVASHGIGLLPCLWLT